MKTQTAVEWFNQQLVDRKNGNGDSRNRDEIFAQALEMEKEQIIDFQLYMSGNEFISNHLWDFEDMAIKFLNSQKQNL